MYSKTRELPCRSRILVRHMPFDILQFSEIREEMNYVDGFETMQASIVQHFTKLNIAR